MVNMEKDYNTSRENLLIKEYGRNVQKMVEFALTVDDRNKRTRLAYIIVTVMQQLNPNPNPNDEYYQKLWNHLYVISNYKLDVDFPYEVIGEEVRNRKPERIPYKDNKIKFRYYGKNMELTAQEITSMEPGKERDEKLVEFANQLKVMYITWNMDIINDDVIAAHVFRLTNGMLILPEDLVLRPANEILKQIKKEAEEMSGKKTPKKPIKKAMTKKGPPKGPKSSGPKKPKGKFTKAPFKKHK